MTTSVADRSWTCSHCLPLSVTSRTTTSSIRAARLALKKKLLEEQQAMEQRHLAEKYKLLEEELNEMDETGSNRSRISKRTSLENVEQWQRKCAKYAEAVHRPQPTDQLAKVASALQLPQDEPEGDSECTAAGPAVDPNTHETEPNKPTAEGLASAEMVQRGGPSETVTGGRHEATFHKPTLNSTVKSSSFPASGRVKGDLQRSTGAVPRTAQKHQEVVNATGNVDPQVPP